MAEWSIAAVLKTAVGSRLPRVRIPLPPPKDSACRFWRMHMAVLFLELTNVQSWGQGLSGCNGALRSGQLTIIWYLLNTVFGARSFLGDSRTGASSVWKRKAELAVVRAFCRRMVNTSVFYWLIRTA